MPRGNGTGPMGMGPMTGRAAGFCAGFATPGFATGGFAGVGRGAGGGFGRRCRNQFYATGLLGWQRATMTQPAPEAPNKVEALKGQAAYLEEALNDVRRRIEELETKKG
ncbi:MAG: DUF5320 domain-containing protein [Planctomycetaceae bacterium]|nr:DUF5320 domain-containing protein [Planctomycetaceae bacterium]